MLFSIWVRALRFFFPFILCLCSSGAAHAALAFGTPESPTPASGTTRQSAVTTLSWWVYRGIGSGLKYDLYWGTDPAPPLKASNISLGNSNYGSYPLGMTSYSTTFYWRVIVRDQQGAYAAGPVWSYTTKASNESPDSPTLRSPVNGELDIPVNPTLDYYSYDFEDYNAVNFDVYLGTDPNPPLIADHVTADKYKPEPLQPSTLYYWRVVVRDTGGAETPGPIWTFTTANTANQIPDTPFNPYPFWYLNPPQATVDLSWESLDPDGEPLTFYVYFGAVYPDSKHPLPLVGTTSDHVFTVGNLIGTRYYWYVEVKDSYWSVKPLYPWQFDNGSVPVLFSRFDARPSGANVEVSWLLQSDETMESYTLYRSEGKSTTRVAITNAPVSGIEGKYVDTSVQAGSTYHYDLLVRTTDGDEFRSPVATVSLPAMGLTLHQNAPNPFNPLTTIRYDLPANARVRLSIIDVAGRRVRTLVDEQQTAGSRSAIWNGRDDAGRAVASGVYFYVLDAGKERLTRKLVLLK